MKPIHLLTLPLAILIITGLIYGNYLLWISACAGQMPCSTGLTLFSFSPAWAALFSGNLAGFLYGLSLPSNWFGILVQLLSLIIGALMLVLGLGMNLSSSVLNVSGSIGVNPQGTKFVQNVGAGLLIWSFVTILEGGWVYTLDQAYAGGAILFLLFLEVVFIIGVIWQTQSSF